MSYNIQSSYSGGCGFVLCPVGRLSELHVVRGGEDHWWPIERQRQS